MASIIDIDSEELRKQVARLTRELNALKRSAARQGKTAYDDSSEAISDSYDTLVEWISASMPTMRKRARALEKTAYDNPVIVAAVGIAVVGLVASLFARKR